MKKLLIAVQSQVIADELSRALVGQWEVSLCGNCRDGKALLKQLQPDALIIDLALPQEGGFSMLADSFPELPPSIIALTAVLNPYVEQNAARWGADYVFQIPFDPELVAACLGSVAALQAVSAKRTAQHLRVLGFSAGVNGYYCLLLAVSYLKEDFSQHLHKEIYSRVARVLHVDPRAVERAIRTAVLSAWKRRNAGTWENYFPVNKSGEVECPTNKEFIVSLAQRI